MVFSFSEDMDEITGVGGMTERAARAAVCAGAAWWEAHPHAFPIIDGGRHMPGFIEGHNAEGRSLVSALKCTVVPTDDGAKVPLDDLMSHELYYVVLEHVMAVGSLGWAHYTRQMRSRPLPPAMAQNGGATSP